MHSDVMKERLNSMQALYERRMQCPSCVYVCVFITGESESQNKEKQIWSYEERR